MERTGVVEKVVPLSGSFVNVKFKGDEELYTCGFGEGHVWPKVGQTITVIGEEASMGFLTSDWRAGE